MIRCNAILYGVFALLLMASCQKPGYDWDKNYQYNAENPYDLLVLHELLKDRDEGLEILTNDFSRKLNDAEDANYMVFERGVALDSPKLAVLREFVYQGNNAFIISHSAPYSIFNNLYSYYDYPYYEDSFTNAIAVKFKNEEATYPFTHHHKNKPGPHNWHYFVRGDLYSDTASQPEPISYVADTCVNFFKVQFGKGSFYFHTQPVLFTNFMLKEPSGFEHLQKVLADLNSGEVYWDMSYRYRQIEDGEGFTRSAAPLKLFFSHRSLKWSWFAFLIASTLFLLFRSKRLQRIIPIMEVNRNESKDFVQNVGNLYFANGKHKYIAAEMYDTFLADARNHYQIDTNQSVEDIFKQLAKKSGLGEETLGRMLEEFKLRFDDYGKSQDLITLYHSLNHYYKSRK